VRTRELRKARARHTVYRSARMVRTAGAFSAEPLMSSSDVLSAVDLRENRIRGEPPSALEGFCSAPLRIY
jgi:hypothetical protein